MISQVIARLAAFPDPGASEAFSEKGSLSRRRGCSFTENMQKSNAGEAINISNEYA